MTIPESVNQVTADLAAALSQAGPSPPHRHLEAALNEATNRHWSVSYTHQSDRGTGLSEILRLTISLGDSPKLWANALLTIHTRQGDITHEGAADGNPSIPGDSDEIRRQALANAIRTLLP